MGADPLTARGWSPATIDVAKFSLTMVVAGEKVGIGTRTAITKYHPELLLFSLYFAKRLFILDLC
jgi:hypothetical protein